MNFRKKSKGGTEKKPINMLIKLYFFPKFLYVLLLLNTCFYAEALRP